MRKKKKKEISPVIFGIIFSIFLSFFIAFSNYRIIQEREGNKELIESLKAEIEQLEGKKENLQQGILESQDIEHIERVLREDFLMKKPGEEKVVILLSDEEPEEIIEETVEETLLQRLLKRLPWR